MNNIMTTAATEIAEQHRLAQTHAGAAIEHARRAGELLLRVKASLKHGEWMPWVSANCAFTIRTADRYMHAAAPTPKLVKPSNFRKPLGQYTNKDRGRLQQLDRARHRDDVVAHAVYLVAELPVAENLRAEDIAALTQLRERIDAVLGAAA